MKRFVSILIIILGTITLYSCSSKPLELPNTIYEETTKDQLEDIISQYLDALSNNNFDSLNKLLTPSKIKLDEEHKIPSNLSLEKILKSARLLSTDIQSFSNDTVKVFAKVELICYDDAETAGDWVPGKSINEKTFELKNIDGEWKINAWGHF